MIQGQDWSGYQEVAPNVTGLDFAFVKITEGLSYVNPRWKTQRDQAKVHGLVWGAYHYPHMANDPKAEADYFLRQVSWQPGDIIVLDWEGYDNANVGVSNQRKLAYRDAWLKYVKGKMPDHKVGMYCNTDYWLNLDKTSNCGDFLWIATGGKPAGQPGIKSKWTIHQYSANPVDKDVADFATRADMAAWAGVPGAKPPTQEGSPVTLTEEDLKTIAHTDNVFVAPDKDGTPSGNTYWTMESYLKYGFLQDRETNGLVKQLLTMETAQSAAISKLAQLIGSDIDTKQVVDAVTAAIKDAVVKVDVSVTQPASGGTPA